ncbi:MAG TPA: NUDIX domain-containing protein [Salinivirgaceae bacterium]|nr:NUDIX domain-containing protein [Salinivirgaceae bacterium]HQA76384.1 NUDIX domain-containing protein [Salinivirgaceae bacterium]
MHDIKIFFDDSFLRITDNFSLSDDKNRDFYSFRKGFNWTNIINSLLNDNQKREILIIARKPKKAFKKLKKHFEVIKAAGGVVLNENNEFLVIDRLGKWDFPKGKLEKGEKPKIAAIREVTEECGIDSPTIIDFAGYTHHVFQHKTKTILKTTYWYRMSCKKQPLTPQTSEDIVDAFWIASKYKAIFIENTHASIADFFKTFTI